MSATERVTTPGTSSRAFFPSPGLAFLQTVPGVGACTGLVEKILTDGRVKVQYADGTRSTVKPGDILPVSRSGQNMVKGLDRYGKKRRTQLSQGVIAASKTRDSDLKKLVRIDPATDTWGEKLWMFLQTLGWTRQEPPGIYLRPGYAHGEEGTTAERTVYGAKLRGSFASGDEVMQFISYLRASLLHAHVDLDLSEGYNKGLWVQLRKLGWVFQGGFYEKPWRKMALGKKSKRIGLKIGEDRFEGSEMLMQYLHDLVRSEARKKKSDSPIFAVANMVKQTVAKSIMNKLTGLVSFSNAPTPGGSDPSRTLPVVSPDGSGPSRALPAVSLGPTVSPGTNSPVGPHASRRLSLISARKKRQESLAAKALHQKKLKSSRAKRAIREAAAKASYTSSPPTVATCNTTSQESAVATPAKVVGDRQPLPKRKRSAALEAVALTPDLVQMVQHGIVSEHEARNMMLEGGNSPPEKPHGGVASSASHKKARVQQASSTWTEVKLETPMQQVTHGGSPPPNTTDSPLTLKARAVPVERAAEYILLETVDSYRLPKWLWKELQSLGWYYRNRKYFPPADLTPGQENSHRANVDYFTEPKKVVEFVEYIRCSPYEEIDFRNSFTKNWPILRSAGWTFKKDTNAVHMGGVRSMALSYYCIPGLEVVDGTPGVDIFESASEALDFVSNLFPLHWWSEEVIDVTDEGLFYLVTSSGRKRKMSKRASDSPAQFTADGRQKRKQKQTTVFTPSTPDRIKKEKEEKKAADLAAQMERKKEERARRNLEKQRRTEERVLKRERKLAEKAQRAEEKAQRAKEKARQKAERQEEKARQKAERANERATKHAEKTGVNTEREGTTAAFDRWAEESVLEDSLVLQDAAKKMAGVKHIDSNPAVGFRARLKAMGRAAFSASGVALRKSGLSLPKRHQHGAKDRLLESSDSSTEDSDDEDGSSDVDSEAMASSDESSDDSSEGEGSSDSEADGSTKSHCSSEDRTAPPMTSPLRHWAERKPYSPDSPFSPVVARTRTISVPTFRPIEEVQSDNDAGSEVGEEEDISAESAMLRHYWEELEERNESLFTWLMCDACGKRRKVNRANPKLRGLKNYFYCGNGWKVTENRCNRPCGWLTHCVGAEKASALASEGIHRVEDMLYDKDLERMALTEGVRFEPGTLKPVVLDTDSEPCGTPDKCGRRLSARHTVDDAVV